MPNAAHTKVRRVRRGEGAAAVPRRAALWPRGYRGGNAAP